MQRPKVTQQMIEQAAKRLAADNGWDDDQAAEVAAVYLNHMDGYELAKELERRYVWTITVDDVEALDGMAHEVRAIHREACIAWAKENDIQPPLPVGAATTQGEITGIYEHDAACYLVREPGEQNDGRRLVVRFEDAKPLAPNIGTA